MKKIVLAIDLGGTNLRMAAVSIDGDILHRVKYKTPQSKDPLEIIETIGKAKAECVSNLNGFELVSMAAAVPGIINFEKGLIIQSPNLPETDGVYFARALEKEFGTQAILENDANAASVGENWLGASKGFLSSVMFTLGTGVGGGIILDGNVLRGIDGTAAEIGHVNVEPDGHVCGCGSYGCVEQYASATAVVRMAKEIAKEKLVSEIAENEDLTSQDVYELAKGGDELAHEVFRRQGYYLGIVLAGLINTLNPEIFVIGGGASGGWDLFIPYLKEQIKIRSYKQPAERVTIERAKLGDDAGILGVAKLGFEKSK